MCAGYDIEFVPEDDRHLYDAGQSLAEDDLQAPVIFDCVLPKWISRHVV